MTNPYIFKQYTWMVETIHKARRITFSELSEKWQQTEMSGGMALSRTSFNRYRDAVSDMFGLIIECDRKAGNQYYIYNEKLLQQDTVQNWMFSSLSISGMLHERKRLFDRIMLESHPSADERLHTILHAMYDGHKVEMTYQRYQHDEVKTFTAAPYCLKLFRQRWYVVMGITTASGETRTPVYSIDRITSVKLLPESFKMPAEFDASEFFSESFGVVVGDGTEPVAIRLRAFGRERYSMCDLPIHHSQMLIDEGDGYIDFEVYLRPTADFKAFIASKGQWLVVLSPLSLADDVMKIHQEALDKYAHMRELI